ncbi:nuclease-related domain-containing protein [Alteribacillus sp. YIM 98480]|uniref:nuclease-related domain-containing protein n=1 Tax=Alteribacillus sp. YIM 98480 TaxID=2606599 RepID=UPI00131E5925|nr:nuclease-related domain-containing protein [Alteribacillus sp. YIM 98480]
MLRRIPSGHPSRSKLEDELAKSYAGYRGEQSIDYYLSSLTKKTDLIFHDIRLPSKDKTYFQIDIFVLTTNFCIILEVKNIAGTLYFDPFFHQLIRTLNDKEEGFPDPILQMNRQKAHLVTWLQKNNLPNIPIYSFVVISHPSSVIKTTSSSHFLQKTSQDVIHASAIPTKLHSLIEKHQQEYITIKEQRKIARLLLKQHEPANPHLFKPFAIVPSDIQTGVYCAECFHLPIKKIKGGWLCPVCAAKFPNAHLLSFVDYFLLISPAITNKQFRDFFHVSSVSTATKMLKGLSFDYSGTFKDRVYHIDFAALRKLC